MKHRRQVARDIELASFKVVRTLVSSWCWCLPWMVNGCGLITDNDFQISIKTFFTIFYIPYILWLSKKQDLAHSFDGARREYTVHWCHEDLETSGAVWRHRGEGERRSRYSRDNINPYIRIHPTPARPPGPSLTRRAVWNIKYERNIFPFFCCEWNHKPGCRHTRTLGPISLDAMQPSQASDQMDVRDN